jgi:REP element-mobilizing transposase RayT
VIGRGLERRYIFAQDLDKHDFLKRFGISLADSDAVCFAWAVMSNHYHLLIRVGENPLGKVMAPVLSGYATMYNRRYHRSGYVFQNRFKSILCDEDEYLLKLIRYIHLNPWKAKIVSDLVALDEFAWSGHAGLLGNHVRGWHSTDDILSLFSTKKSEAKQRYRTFIADGMSQQESVDLSGGGLIRSYGGWESLSRMRREHAARIGDERILGSSDFVEMALMEDSLGLTEQTGVKQLGWDLPKLCTAICRYYQLDEKVLLSRGRLNNVSTARQIIAFMAITLLGVRSGDVENQLNVSQSGVSKLVQKGRIVSQRHGLTLSSLSLPANNNC